MREKTRRFQGTIGRTFYIALWPLNHGVAEIDSQRILLRLLGGLLTWEITERNVVEVFEARARLYPWVRGFRFCFTNEGKRQSLIFGPFRMRSFKQALMECGWLARTLPEGSRRMTLSERLAQELEGDS